jgi:uncharacterized protein
MSLGDPTPIRNTWLRDMLGPMTSEPVPDHARTADELRAALRRGLRAALKARDADALAALRVAVAAIDNAEAVATTDTRGPVTSADIAGASSGVGSTEAVRQSLSLDQLRDILRDQMAEYEAEADRLRALGRPADAERSLGRAQILAAYAD